MDIERVRFIPVTNANYTLIQMGKEHISNVDYLLYHSLDLDEMALDSTRFTLEKKIVAGRAYAYILRNSLSGFCVIILRLEIYSRLRSVLVIPLNKLELRMPKQCNRNERDTHKTPNPYFILLLKFMLLSSSKYFVGQVTSPIS